MQTCKGEEECSKAAMARDVCVAKVACPKVAAAFLSALKSGKNMEGAYAKVLECGAGMAKESKRLFPDG